MARFGKRANSAQLNLFGGATSNPAYTTTTTAGTGPYSFTTTGTWAVWPPSPSLADDEIKQLQQLLQLLKASDAELDALAEGVAGDAAVEVAEATKLLRVLRSVLQVGALTQKLAGVP